MFQTGIMLLRLPFRLMQNNIIFINRVANLQFVGTKLRWDIVGNASFKAINIYKGETLIGTVDGTAEEFNVPSEYVEENAEYTVRTVDVCDYITPGVSAVYRYQKSVDETLVPVDAVFTGADENIIYAFDNPSDDEITDVKVALYKDGNFIAEKSSSVTSASGLVTGSIGSADGITLDSTFGAVYEVAVTIDADDRTNTTKYTVLNGNRNSKNALRFATYGLPLSAYNGKGSNQIVKVEPDFKTYKSGNSSMLFYMRGYMKNNGTYATSSAGNSSTEIEMNTSGLDASKYYEFSYYYKGNSPEIYYGTNNNAWNGYPGMQKILNSAGDEVTTVKTTEGDWTKVTGIYKGGSAFYLRFFHEGGPKKFWVDEFSLREANYNADTKTYTVAADAPNLYENGGLDRKVTNLQFKNSSKLVWETIGNTKFSTVNVYKNDVLIDAGADGSANEYIIPSQYIEDGAVYTVKTVGGGSEAAEGVSVIGVVEPGEVDTALVPKNVVVAGGGDRVVFAFNNPADSEITRVRTAIYKGEQLIAQKNCDVTSASGFVTGSYGITESISFDNTAISEYTFKIMIDAANRTNTTSYKFLNGRRESNNKLTVPTYGLNAYMTNDSNATQIVKVEPDFETYKAGTNSMHFNMRGYIKNDGTYSSGSAGYSSLQMEYSSVSALDPAKYYEFSYYYKGSEPEMYYGTNNEVWNNWPGLQQIADGNGNFVKKIKTTEDGWTKVSTIFQGSTFKLRFFHEGGSKEYWIDELSMKEANYNPETKTYTVAADTQNLYTYGGFDGQVISPSIVNDSMIVWLKTETSVFKSVKIYKDGAVIGGVDGNSSCFVIPESKWNPQSTYTVATLVADYELPGVDVTNELTPVFTTRENNLSGYLKFESDVVYKRGNDISINLIKGDTASELVEMHKNGIVIGGSRLVADVTSGTYHINAVLNYKNRLALVTVTLPNGKVVQSSNVEYFGGFDTIEEIIFISLDNTNKAEDIFKNIEMNIPGDSDLPKGMGMNNIKIYDNGNVVSDIKKVPVSANKITIDMCTPILDKALIDGAVSVSDVQIASTAYENGIYTINLGSALESDTVYTISFDKALTSVDKSFDFATKPAEFAEITGITKSGAAVDELADLKAGDTVRVALNKNINSGYSVLAAGYTTYGELKFTQLVNDSADVKIDTLTDVNEVKFYVWDMSDGMKSLSDVYILPANTFETDDVYNLVTTFVGDAGKERGFAWTAQPEFTDMVIQYAEKGSFWSDENVADAEYTDYNGILYYKAEIDGLTPGKAYVYRIGDTADDVWSKTYTFTTEAENTDEFTFIGITDPQSGAWSGGYEYMKYTLDAAMKDAPETSFMVNLGDLTDDGREEGHWKNHFKALSGYGESLPYMAVMGNHETRGDAVTAGKNFSLHFNNPDNGAGALGDLTADDVSQDYSKGVVNNIAETVYSFEYGDAYFAVLNTGSDWSKADSYVMLEKQKEWLRNDMSASDKKWKIVMLHVGLYPAKAERWSSQAVLEDVLIECGVDLVLGGHDHIVSRTYAMNNGQIVSGEAFDTVQKDSGFVYTILGCSGTKRYEKVGTIPAYSATLNATNSTLPTYTLFNVNDNAIEVVTKQIDGALVDSFIISE